MKDILGIGTDIIEVERIKNAILRHGSRFLETLFSEKERAYCDRFSHPSPHYAGRFAAKEAILKALGTGLQEGISWQDIEILNTPLGAPEVHLSSRMREKHPEACFLLTISHCHDYATATAILGKE